MLVLTESIITGLFLLIFGKQRRAQLKCVSMAIFFRAFEYSPNIVLC